MPQKTVVLDAAPCFWDPFKEEGDDYVLSFEVSSAKRSAVLIKTYGDNIEIDAWQRRFFSLPHDVNLDEIHATHQGNRVTIRLPRMKGQEPRQIPVSRARHKVFEERSSSGAGRNEGRV